MYNEAIQLEEQKNIFDKCFNEVFERREDKLQGFIDKKAPVQSQSSSNNSAPQESTMKYTIYNFDQNNRTNPAIPAQSDSKPVPKDVLKSTYNPDLIAKIQSQLPKHTNTNNPLYPENKENSYIHKYLAKKKKLSISIEMPLKAEGVNANGTSNFRRTNIKNI